MKKIIKIFSVLIIALVLTSYTNMSMATSMNELKNEQSNIENQITSTQEDLDQVTEEKSEALEQVEELVTKISSYNSEIEELEEKIKDLENDIKDAEKQIKKDEEEYAELEETLGQRLVAMYKTGETSYLDFLLSSSSLTDFISSYYLISQVAEYDTKMLEQLQEHKEKIEADKTKLENSKKELDNSKTTLTAKQNALKVVKSEKQEYADKLSKKEKELANTLEELVEYEKTISSKIKQLQKEYDEQLKKQQAANTSSSSSSNSNSSSSSYGFGWPVSNPVLTTGYGVSGRYWSLGYHTGVDFRASVGTPVYAIGDGMVVSAGYSRAYGYHVIIYHGNNIYSLYAHASSLSVSTGQTVTKGKKIMLSGDTGNVTGPHLHFEIRTPGSGFYNCVNPTPYLP